MLEYMFNNLSLIDKFQNLYKDGIDIRRIQRQFLSGELTKGDLNAHTRFRVFLDQCLLLLNKEKMTYYLNSHLSFGDYLKELNNNETIKAIINSAILKAAMDKTNLNINTAEAELFYSLDGKKYNPWHQGDIIRRAAAHAQYSTFVSADGGILFFYVDNIDEQMDIHGIVIEEIFHDWVRTFFSNYTTVGIPYKHTCISFYSFLKEKLSETPLWITFKISDSYDQNYDGRSHPMRELGMQFREPDNLIDYVKTNKALFDITEKPLYSLLDTKQICSMQLKYSLHNKGAITYGIKTILDSETEISNFIVHLSLLNDVILQTILSNKFAKNDMKNIQNLMILQLDELVEDQNANLAFKLGFSVLKAMNLAFRMEKNKSELEKYGKNTLGIDLDNLKYPALDYSEVDISGFIFNSDEAEDFCKKENITQNKNKHFVLKKIRNALTHGNIRFKIDCKNEVVFVFDDKYHKRTQTVEIDEESFDKFLNQKALYKQISNQGISFPIGNR